MALVNELKRLKYKYSLVFTIIFRFLRTLLITLILDERYMCCSIKIQNNSPHNYIAYGLASYYFRGEIFCQSLVTSYQSLVTSYQSLVTSHQLLVISHQLLVTSHQLLVSSHQILVTGCQPPASRKLVTSQKSLVTSI